MQMHYDEQADRIIEAMETAHDDLDRLRTVAASAAAEAKRIHARALLEARTIGLSSREEREAHATLASADAGEAADIAERTYRDTLTFGITGDYDTAPDLGVLADGIRSSMQELLAAVGQEG